MKISLIQLLAFFCLWGFMPPSGNAQPHKKVRITHTLLGSGAEQSKELIFQDKIIYKRNAAQALSGDSIIAVYQPNEVFLQVRLLDPSGELEGKELDFKIITEGGGAFRRGNYFHTTARPKQIKDGELRGDILIPIDKSGKGTLTIEFYEIQPSGGIQVVREKSRKTFEYQVIAMAEHSRALYKVCSDSPLKSALERQARLIGQFSFFKEPRFDKVADSEKIRPILLALETDIDECHSDLRSKASPRDPASLRNYYHAFGTQTLPILKSYKDAAIAHLNALEIAQWSAINTQDIRSYEAFLEIFSPLKDLGYPPIHQDADIQQNIAHLISQWSANPGAPDFCEKYDRILQSDYYQKHKNDSRFASAQKACSPKTADPCAALKQKYRKAKNIQNLNEHYAECLSLKCSGLCDEIKGKIACVNCENLFTQAEQEPNVDVKISLLERIMNDCAQCGDLKSKAKELQGNILPPDLILDGPFKETDPATGRMVYRFTATITAGVDVRIHKIDDQINPDSNGANVKFYLKSNAPQPVWEFKVFDFGDVNRHVVTFQSRSLKTSERALMRDQFELKILELGEGEIILLPVNGFPPYWAEFSQGSKKFYYPLSNSAETRIPIAELAKTHAGKWLVKAQDNNGVFAKKDMEVDFPTRFWDTWNILLLPCLLIIGLIIYRNTTGIKP